MTNKEILSVLNEAKKQMTASNPTSGMTVWDHVCNVLLHKNRMSIIEFIPSCPEMGVPMYFNAGLSGLDQIIDMYQYSHNKEISAQNFEWLTRYNRWNHNRTVDESLSEETFMEAFEDGMGPHYWGKWLGFQGDLFKMTSYFYGETDNGQRLLGMIEKCMLKYEERVEKYKEAKKMIQIEPEMHNAYVSDDPEIKKELANQIERTSIANEGLDPYIDKDYWCETCGSKDGKCHPDTSLCFHCNADDWEPYNLKNICQNTSMNKNEK